MLIIDWSSDVCSSDLYVFNLAFDRTKWSTARSVRYCFPLVCIRWAWSDLCRDSRSKPNDQRHALAKKYIINCALLRRLSLHFSTTERLVGKERVRTCRSRWQPST